MAQKGLPKINGKYFAHIDPPPISITEFSQNTKYRGAVEGYLALSIETFREIEKATVSLNKDTTATVEVKLHQYKELEGEQIKAIQLLVASAENELKAEQVSILDDKGNDLIAKYEAKYKAEYETYNPTRKNVRSCGSSCGDGGY